MDQTIINKIPKNLLEKINELKLFNIFDVSNTFEVSNVSNVSKYIINFVPKTKEKKNYISYQLIIAPKYSTLILQLYLKFISPSPYALYMWTSTNNNQSLKISRIDGNIDQYEIYKDRIQYKIPEEVEQQYISNREQVNEQPDEREQFDEQEHPEEQEELTKQEQFDEQEQPEEQEDLTKQEQFEAQEQEQFDAQEQEQFKAREELLTKQKEELTKQERLKDVNYTADEFAKMAETIQQQHDDVDKFQEYPLQNVEYIFTYESYRDILNNKSAFYNLVIYNPSNDKILLKKVKDSNTELDFITLIQQQKQKSFLHQVTPSIKHYILYNNTQFTDVIIQIKNDDNLNGYTISNNILYINLKFIIAFKNTFTRNQTKESPDQTKESPDQTKETPDQTKETPNQTKETPNQTKETPNQTKTTTTYTIIVSLNPKYNYPWNDNIVSISRSKLYYMCNYDTHIKYTIANYTKSTYITLYQEIFKYTRKNANIDAETTEAFTGFILDFIPHIIINYSYNDSITINSNYTLAKQKLQWLYQQDVFTGNMTQEYEAGRISRNTFQILQHINVDNLHNEILLRMYLCFKDIRDFKFAIKNFMTEIITRFNMNSTEQNYRTITHELIDNYREIIEYIFVNIDISTLF